jgi:hypothetical protein
LVGNVLSSLRENPTMEVNDGRRTFKKDGHGTIPQREITNLNLR